MSQSVTTNNDKQNNDKKNSKLYKSRKIVGKGLKKIGTTLGAIGTPIFAVVPPLRPFSFLLGENSLYYQLGKVIEGPVFSPSEKKDLGREKTPFFPVQPKEGGYNYPNYLFHHVY